jgi:hypothetical protein
MMAKITSERKKQENKNSLHNVSRCYSLSYAFVCLFMLEDFFVLLCTFHFLSSFGDFFRCSTFRELCVYCDDDDDDENCL